MERDSSKGFECEKTVQFPGCRRRWLIHEFTANLPRSGAVWAPLVPRAGVNPADCSL
jgi:hypothetical protein